MRFTLKWLLLAVAMLALACAGMSYANDLWASAIWTLTWMLYVFGIVKAISNTGRDRITCIGFVLAGWGYIMFHKAAIFSGEVLLPNHLLALIAKSTLIDIRNTNASQIVANGLSASYGPTALPHLFAIGNCAFSWIFAVLAAWFARRMYDRRGKE